MSHSLKKTQTTKSGPIERGIDSILSSHKGLIPEGHSDRQTVAAHVNKLMSMGGGANVTRANEIYKKHISATPNKTTGYKEDINSVLARHPGTIPEDHADRITVASHVNKLMSMGPNEKATARVLYDRHLKKSKLMRGHKEEQLESVLKSKDNHPKGGLTISAAKKLGIHAGIETHREVEKKGGVSKLSDKTKSRRRSFCARHCGMKRKFPDAYKKKDSKGNKALRVWHCGSCSNWLKKSIGSDDQISFYKDGNVLDVYLGSDVPFEVESIIVDSILAKNYVEVEKELNKSRCWTGYKPVPGKKPYDKDSCEPIKKDDDIDSKMGRLKDQLKANFKNYGKIKVRGNPEYHIYAGVHDSGLAAHEPGGGNIYHVVDPKTGKMNYVHQSQIEDLILSKSKKEYCEDKDKLIGEHKRLIGKLKSKSSKERDKEAKIQSRELREMSKSDDEKIKQIKDKYRTPKEPSMGEKVKQIKDKHRSPKEPSTDEKIKQIKDKYRAPKEPSDNEKIKQIKDKYRAPKEQSMGEKIKQIKDKHRQKGTNTDAAFGAIKKTVELIYGSQLNSKNFRQPTDEELFGHLVASDTINKTAEHKWENAIGGWFQAAAAPVNSKFSSEEEELAYWRSLPTSNREED